MWRTQVFLPNIKTNLKPNKTQVIIPNIKTNLIPNKTQVLILNIKHHFIPNYILVRNTQDQRMKLSFFVASYYQRYLTPPLDHLFK